MTKADALDLRWLQWVTAPVLVLDRNRWLVIEANAPCRRSLGLTTEAGEAAEPLVGMIGEAAIEEIAAFLANLPPDGSRNALYLNGLTPAGQKPLVMHFNRMEVDGPDWVVTIDDLAPFFDGDSPTNAENTFRSIIQTLPIGIEIYDRNLRGLFYNGLSDAWFMYGNYADSQLHEWWEPAFPDPADRARAMAEWDALIGRARGAPGQPQTIEWSVLCADGIQRTVKFQLGMVGDHFTLTFTDVSEQRRLEASLRSLASTDTLTGVYNRRYFFDRAALVLRQARARARPVSLLMVDVDHFKSVNDRFGHRAGDQALVAVAERCKSVLRETDVLARFGGEEFIILLPNTTQADAHRIAARLHRAVSADPIAVENGELRLTVSIGLSSSAAGAPSIDPLIDSADTALYTAKRRGRDQIASSADALGSE